MMTKKAAQNNGIVEPDYQIDPDERDDSIQRLINPNPDLIEHDADIDSETIDGAIEEIIKRKHFWEKYSLLRGLEVKYGELLKELKHEKVIRQLVKDRFKAEDLTIIEAGQGRKIDLNKVEGLVQIVKSIQLKEDVLRGAIPILKSDKENEVFSIFFMAARNLKVDHPRVAASCIEGMLYMVHGLEDKLDKERLDQISEVSDRFVSAHLSPITIKHGFDYALERQYFHLMAKLIENTGRLIRIYRTKSPDKAIDVVRAINLDVSDFVEADIDFREVLERSIVKELIAAGAIELACKLAKRYGITEQENKAEVYELLLDIQKMQQINFENYYGDLELQESE